MPRRLSQIDDEQIAEAITALADLLEQSGAEGRPRSRHGPGLAWILVIGLGGAGVGGVGGYRLLSADPGNPAAALAQRIAVDLDQADAALRDPAVAAIVADRIGAAIARGAVECTVEWRTDGGELVVRDRIRGMTDTAGRAHRYRVGEKPPTD